MKNNREELKNLARTGRELPEPAGSCRETESFDSQQKIDDPGK
jgi:hypothetical protein